MPCALVGGLQLRRSCAHTVASSQRHPTHKGFAARSSTRRPVHRGAAVTASCLHFVEPLVCGLSPRPHRAHRGPACITGVASPVNARADAGKRPNARQVRSALGRRPSACKQRCASAATWRQHTQSMFAEVEAGCRNGRSSVDRDVVPRSGQRICSAWDGARPINRCARAAKKRRDCRPSNRDSSHRGEGLRAWRPCHRGWDQRRVSKAPRRRLLTRARLRGSGRTSTGRAVSHSRGRSRALSL